MPTPPPPAAPNPEPAQAARRALAVLVTPAAFLVLAVAAAIVVGVGADPDDPESGPAAASARDTGPGSGVVSRTEVTTVWLPRALLELARREPEAPPQSRDDLRAYLDRHGLRGTWYAVSWTAPQPGGRPVTLTQARGTGLALGDLAEFGEVMATAAGRPPRSDTRDFTHAAVRVIPDALLAARPLDAVRELTDRPAGAEDSD